MRGWRALANSAHLGRKRLPLFAEQKIFRACLIKRSFSFPAREQSAFMKAVVQNNAQLDANSLRLADDQPVPTPDPEQVLIKVAYAGVNRPDLMQRRGLYPPPSGHSPVLGLEVSGTVVATGAAVTVSAAARAVGRGWAVGAAAPTGRRATRCGPAAPKERVAARCSARI